MWRIWNFRIKFLKNRNSEFQKSPTHFCGDHWGENSGQVWQLLAAICKRGSILQFSLPKGSMLTKTKIICKKSKTFFFQKLKKKKKKKKNPRASGQGKQQAKFETNPFINCDTDGWQISIWMSDSCHLSFPDLIISGACKMFFEGVTCMSARHSQLIYM